MPRTCAPLVAVLLSPLPSLAQQAPWVVQLTPAHQSVEVDAKQVRELVVKFDQPMRKRSHSFCGGGPTFPKVEKIVWKDDRTVVLKVRLEPDHSYAMSVNCPAAQNFMSRAGVRARSTPWQFTTLPTKLLPAEEQQKINAAALEQLADVLATHYSYYEYRKLDWPKVFAAAKPGILAAKTTRGWAQAVGKMLAPANDLHLYLRYGSQTVGTGRRAVDSLYRARLLSKYLKDVKQPIRGVLTGRTEDGTQYLMISSWTQQIPFDQVEEHLASLVECERLILDVRPNAGGAENLAARVAKWFVQGRHVYAKHVVRKGKGAKNFLPVYSRRIVGNPKNRRLDCKVAVLMSRYCMSSCEAFLLMMKQAKSATLIGQRSYGSSGNPQQRKLDNGVMMLVPCWKAMRVDGSCFEGEGIAPDIEVQATSKDLQTRDPILERALAHLKQ